jgi:hypothetical protein
MKITITKAMFRDMFNAVRPDNFSYAGLGSLFDLLEDLEEQTGVEVPFDVIALCCEYAEMGYEEIADIYGVDIEGMEHEQALEAVRDWLSENTVYAECLDGVFVFQQF